MPVCFLIFLISITTVFGSPDVQTFFADDGTPQSELLNDINTSHQSIHLCMYSFTDRELGRALVKAYQRGVDVRLILDESETRERNSEANYLTQNLGQGRVILRNGRGGTTSIMHHKFAIFDGERVATGSYNWTASARNYNYENLIILSGVPGHDTAQAFEKEFKRICSSL